MEGKKRKKKKGEKTNRKRKEAGLGSSLCVEVGAWAFLGVVCVLLSGGNVGGEMVQKEEEGGREG